MGEWKETLLTDITTKIGDGLHGTPKYDNSGKYYFINGNNLVKGKIHIKEDTKKVNEDEYLKYAKPLNERTLLLGINGTIGNIAYFRNEKCLLGKSACYINLNNEVDINFIYYILISDDFQLYIQGIATGTTIPNVPLKGLREYRFKLPILPEQTAIASILSSLDNKIDLLHRQNATLEKMAETLFRQWFVEEAKEEWEIGKISDYALHFKDSIHPQKNKSTTYFHFSIPSFDNNKNPIKELGKEIQSNKYKVPEYCILFSKLNPHKDKRLWLLQNEVDPNAICSTEFQVVLPKKKEHLYFLYCWLNLNENYNEIASGVGGTSGSHQRIDPNTIYDFQCPIISDNLIEKLSVKLKPLFKKQVNNQIQIRTLTAMRDTLLPKLMSGEVRVEV
jgi:type I restriction enzyme S subunit